MRSFPTVKKLPLYLRPGFLSKLPAILLVCIFLLPVVLVKINYQIGLFFIAFYISYWAVKVFESYYYVIRSYLTLLEYKSADLSENEILLEHAPQIRHVIIVPIYTEPYDVIEENVQSIVDNTYPHLERVTILLATESRVPDAALHAANIIKHFQKSPVEIVNVIHPE